MREIHTALISLGYTILHPNVLCRIRREHEPGISSSLEERKGATFLSPDIILRVKHNEEYSANEDNHTKSSELQGVGELPKCSCIKKEETKKREAAAPQIGQQKMHNVSVTRSDEIATEQEFFHSGEEQISLASRGASQLFFNPTFSIWIKKEDEPFVEDAPSTALPTACPGENLQIVKQEEEFAIDKCKVSEIQDSTQLFSDKENSQETHEIVEDAPFIKEAENATKGEESLLSIVLRRTDTGSYQYSSSCKGLEYTQALTRIAEKKTCYKPKQPLFLAPNKEVLSVHVHTDSHQKIAQATNKPFQCNICEKYFKTLGILNVHIKTHSGVRPHQCTECGRGFRDNWNLKVHQKIHTGETAYKCSVCEKGFIQYATYMKHQRVHTGEKPYSCCYCNKRFTNSSNLLRHHRTHTGEKPYTCMECGKSFSYNTSLTQHKRVHIVPPI
ncbi:zinc finger protein 664-like isoform X2 [Hyperolius riggenbachi]